jgi:TetR/AcrR family transcriptional repressor of nem operon
MPRPPTYAREDVVRAAREAFWDDGYEGTPVSELEERTGLMRSSLYLAFGSKRELFRSALDSYVNEVLDPLLAPMELDAPDLQAIETFFSGVKAIVGRAGGHGRRGCLMVNTVAELATRDDDAASRSVAFRDRLHDAFARALEGAAASGEIAHDTLGRRADVLTAATFGIWLTARIDPVAAASLCNTMTSEVEYWRSSHAVGGASHRRR